MFKHEHRARWQVQEQSARRDLPKEEASALAWSAGRGRGRIETMPQNITLGYKRMLAEAERADRRIRAAEAEARHAA